jgi:hypothetical protein
MNRLLNVIVLVTCSLSRELQPDREQESGSTSSVDPEPPNNLNVIHTLALERTYHKNA